MPAAWYILSRLSQYVLAAWHILSRLSQIRAGCLAHSLPTVTDTCQLLGTYSPDCHKYVSALVAFSNRLSRRRDTSFQPQLDQVQESARPEKITNQCRTFNTIGERLMVKEESEASVGTRPWTPEGRSLTLSIAFML
ncbi:hypothetical protein AVEN_190876-1 [Araneus ventricosus]|uniref:Uncharacterized protein n=1 Tax=Araneus ventricosus TaxID=182803 RepID=A0A4Y2CS65_ARAVE|nr:hypothetical protein AVEN_190876-1 [Araneus ventricosus]